MSNKSKSKPKLMPTIKLDLGCGQNKQTGYTGVDLYAPGADVKLDLMASKLTQGGMEFIKWPWKDNSVDELFASHFVEHIPSCLRWPFFEECYRILKPEGTMRIFVPNWKSERAYGDMTHQWPPVTAMFFLYLNKGWREANKLTYGPYDVQANFDHQAGPTGLNGDFGQKAHEVQVFAATHYCESYPDMWVTLTKRPMNPLVKNPTP
jgi:hypothetical protein